MSSRPPVDSFIENSVATLKASPIAPTAAANAEAKFALLWPEDVGKAYLALRQQHPPDAVSDGWGNSPRGFMFWNIADEGMAVHVGTDPQGAAVARDSGGSSDTSETSDDGTCTSTTSGPELTRVLWLAKELWHYLNPAMSWDGLKGDLNY
jgi:hypothetical protein